MHHEKQARLGTDEYATGLDDKAIESKVTELVKTGI